MPSGHPNDPAEYRAKMRAAAAKRAAKRQEDITKVRQLVVQGVSYADAAAELGISESSVLALLAPAPIRKHTAKKSTAKKRAVRKSAVQKAEEKKSDEALATLREKLTGDDRPLLVKRIKDLEVLLDDRNQGWAQDVEKIRELEAKVEASESRAWQQQEQTELAERRLAILFDLIGGNGAQTQMRDLSQLS